MVLMLLLPAGSFKFLEWYGNAPTLQANDEGRIVSTVYTDEDETQQPL